MVMDLDGTVYRGPAPYRHYAQLIARSMAPDARRAYLQALEQFIAGESEVRAADGWEAAVVLARGAGSKATAFHPAFLATRRFMLEDRCEVEVPSGMMRFLALARTHARVILATNTPAPYVFPLLRRLGLGDSFDEVCCGAEKPSRFGRRLIAWAELFDLPTRLVLSVGDHFVNDIAPALSAGCTTAYIDPFGVGPAGQATFASRDFEGLAEPLSKWVASTAWSSVAGQGAESASRVRSR